MQQIMRVTINPVGQPKIEMVGFTGGRCVTAAKPVIDALSNAGAGVKVEESVDMYMQDTTKQVEFEGL